MASWNSTNRRKYISISLVCLLMGILIGLSSQVYFLLQSAGTADNKSQDLIEVIAKLEADNADLEAEIDAIRAELSTSNNPLNDVEALDRLKAQVYSLLSMVSPQGRPGILCPSPCPPGFRRTYR